MSLFAMSVRLSVCPSRKKLLTTVLNINLPCRLISNSSRISDRANVCFFLFQRAYFYVSLGSVWLKESSDSNYKLQIYFSTDVLYKSVVYRNTFSIEQILYYFHCVFYVNVIYIFMCNIYKAHYSQFNML